MKLELELYTPSEAEEITKVAQTTVRNWRRAGHLPRQQGHARYTIVDVLLMTAMQSLVSRGVTPEAAKGFAPQVARAIFQSMIYSTKSYSAAVVAAAKLEVGEIAPERIERVKAAMGGGFELEMLEDMDRLSLMVDASEQLAGIAGLKHPSWLIIWADGVLEFLHDDEDPDESFFGNIQYDEAYAQGAVIMFCLGAMARMVIDRLPRHPIKLVGEV